MQSNSKQRKESVAQPSAEEIINKFKGFQLPKIRLKRLIRVQARMRGYYTRKFLIPRKRIQHRLIEDYVEKKCNSLILALITLGEGWHNNHHRYQACTRQGFYWWEIDITYYGLKALSWTGFIWDLKPVPKSILEEAARADHASTVAAAQRAAHHNPDYSYGTLKKVVPAAAAIAVATASASQVTVPKKADGPAIHKDVTEETHPNARQSQPNKASTPPRDA